MYGFGTKITGSFDEVVEKVTAALKEQGFGILTEIDVKATLKKKLDVDFRRYVILGACNPQLAHQAVSMLPEIGLLLPCNVVVRQDDEGAVHVSFLDPEKMLGLAGAEEDFYPEVADLLNRFFVSVKVDREERPDVDQVYMNVCQALTGRQLYRIPEQVVVVPAFGNDFIQGLGLCAGGLFTNSLFRGHLGYGNGAAGDHGERMLHRTPHRRPLGIGERQTRAGRGRGERNMVVIPYRDRLALLGLYLQQLVMESLGKALDRSGSAVHQGLTVYGRKGSSDQHAYVQQLREGGHLLWLGALGHGDAGAAGLRWHSETCGYRSGLVLALDRDAERSAARALLMDRRTAIPARRVVTIFRFRATRRGGCGRK